MSNFLELTHYRLQVAKLYDSVRDDNRPVLERFEHFKRVRDELFKHHSQSPLSVEQKEAFEGLEYYPFDPTYRFELRANTDVVVETFEIPLRDDGVLQLERVATVTLPLDTPVKLSLFWLKGYGGGLFLPFRDATNDSETYGGGRYLLDTIKHADLGQKDGKLILDFNFSYNPSCAYNSTWDCPLAPFENRLELSLPVGEKKFKGDFS